MGCLQRLNMIIAEFHQVLDELECQLLIDVAKKNLQKLTVIGSNEGNYRNGEGTWIYNDVFTSGNINVTEKIKYIVSRHTSMPVENQEKIHIVRYGIGGEYKEHHDFFHANQVDYVKNVSKGGQRLYSCLFYLNDNFTGGETKFVKKNVIVKPCTGKMLLWSNMKDDGMILDYDSLHAGLPVISGEKWIAIVWVRQTNFVFK